MTLKHKRSIVRMFLGGDDIDQVVCNIFEGWITHQQRHDVEQVLRDYINGKFTLEPKRKVKK